MSREEAILALKGLLEAGGNRFLTIRGTSMAPFLATGDRVEVEAVPPALLRLGDLIAFLQDGKVIVHRYAGRVNRAGIPYLRQKGDGLRGFGLVPAADLLGRVVRVATPSGERGLMVGWGRWDNRIRGLSAWGFCSLRGALHILRGPFRRQAP
jgi:hypothetical protein